MTNVFVLITSEKCGACKGFLAKYWDFLREKLEEIPNIKVVHVQLSGTDSVPICEQSFNPDVINYVAAYPSFVTMKYVDFIYSPIQMKPEYFYAVDDRYAPLRTASRDITSIENWVRNRVLILNETTQPVVKTKNKVRRQVR